MVRNSHTVKFSPSSLDYSADTRHGIPDSPTTPVSLPRSPLRSTTPSQPINCLSLWKPPYQWAEKDVRRKLKRTNEGCPVTGSVLPKSDVTNMLPHATGNLEPAPLRTQAILNKLNDLFTSHTASKHGNAPSLELTMWALASFFQYSRLPELSETRDVRPTFNIDENYPSVRVLILEESYGKTISY